MPTAQSNIRVLFQEDLPAASLFSSGEPLGQSIVVSAFSMLQKELICYGQIESARMVRLGYVRCGWLVKVCQISALRMRVRAHDHVLTWWVRIVTSASAIAIRAIEHRQQYSLWPDSAPASSAQLPAFLLHEVWPCVTRPKPLACVTTTLS